MEIGKWNFDWRLHKFWQCCRCIGKILYKMSFMEGFGINSSFDLNRSWSDCKNAGQNFQDSRKVSTSGISTSRNLHPATKTLRFLLCGSGLHLSLFWSLGNSIYHEKLSGHPGILWVLQPTLDHHHHVDETLHFPSIPWTFFQFDESNKAVGSWGARRRHSIS